MRFVFGESLGDEVADEILTLIRRGPQTRNDIRKFLGGHHDASRIAGALGLLLRFGLADFREEQTGGRPAEVWFCTDGLARKAG